MVKNAVTNDAALPRSVGEILESAAMRSPNFPSITCEGQTFTWRETAERCRGLANAMCRLGIKAGDRVAYLGYNSHRYFEMFYAPALIGAILVPINFRLSLREMLEWVEDSAPMIIVADAEHLERAQAIAAGSPSVKIVINASDEPCPENTLAYESLVTESPGEFPVKPSSGDDTLVIFFTGGTTGRSKGVMLSHANLLANCQGTIPFHEMVDHEIHLLTAPLFHVASGYRVYTAAILALHTVILTHFNVESVLSAIEHYRVQGIQVVPTMLQMILDHYRFPEYDLSSLRMISYAAAPMPAALIKRAIEYFPGIRFYQAYGMTEASPVVTMLGPDDHTLSESGVARLQSVGRPADHVDVKIVDGQRKPAAQGETGEIAVRGPNVMKGYWRASEQTRAVMQDGWYYTGDSGYVNAEGYLVLVGRIKDMIISGGENIYPIEVENVLSSHPAVKECAVISLPHPTWGEAVHAVIRLRDDTEQVTEAELIQYCRSQIASYKCPKGIMFREEPMPMSGVNKVLKTVLRNEYGSKQ